MSTTIASATGTVPVTPLVVTAMDPTSIEAVRANILAGSKATISALNVDLLNRYLSLFNDYCRNVDTGRWSPDPTSPLYMAPPLPPFAWELAPPDQNGFVFYQVSLTTIVCPMPPLPADHSKTQAQMAAALAPNVTDIGHVTGNPGWYTVGPLDSRPNGYIATVVNPMDSTTHTFQKVGTPFGSVYEELT